METTVAEPSDPPRSNHGPVRRAADRAARGYAPPPLSTTPSPSTRAAVIKRDEVRTLKVCGLEIMVSERPARGIFAHEPPLLMCNGIGASLNLLQPLVDALHPDRGIVRFDVPGIGGSPLPPCPYPLIGLASWITALMHKLCHHRFDVLGMSWGGALAQQLAVQSQHRVRSVVLVATSTGSLMVPARPKVLLRMAMAHRHRDQAHVRQLAADIYGGSMRVNPARGAQLLRATHLRPNRGYYYQLLAAASWTSLPILSLIRQPTLVLAGDDDPIIPVANARIMGALIPRAELHVYSGGHLGILTESDQLAPVIETFLRRAPASP